MSSPQYNKAKGTSWLVPPRNGWRNATYPTHMRGMEAEGRFITWASKQGWDIFRGLDGHTACDYVIEKDDQLHRVEVKGVFTEQASQRNFYYVLVSGVDKKKFDYLFVHTPNGDYWIPASECPKATLSIKVQKSPEGYERNITSPGKYERYLVA